MSLRCEGTNERSEFVWSEFVWSEFEWSFELLVLKFSVVLYMETIILLSALGVILSSYTRGDIEEEDKLQLQQLQKDIETLRELKVKEMKEYDALRTKADVLANPFVRPEKLDDIPYPRHMYPLATRGVTAFNYIGNAIGDGNQIIKIFGRPKHRGSTEFEYYAIYNNNQDPTKIPLSNIKKEIFDGDTINVPFLGGDFKVNVFESKQFEYNPDVF